MFKNQTLITTKFKLVKVAKTKKVVAFFIFNAFQLQIIILISKTILKINIKKLKIKKKYYQYKCCNYVNILIIFININK